MDDPNKTPQPGPRQPQQPQQPGQPPYQPYPSYTPPGGVPNPAQPQYPYAYGQYAYPQAAQPPQKADFSPRTVLPAGLLVVAILTMLLGLVFGGQVATFAFVGLTIAPFMLLAALAHAGTKNQAAAVLAYIVLLALMLILGIVDLALGLVTFTTGAGASGLPSEAGPALIWTFLLLALAGLISLAMLLRPVRVFVSRVLPIDPDNLVHTIALCILAFFLLGSFVPLIVSGGKPPLLEAFKNPAVQNRSSEVSVGPLEQFYQFMWMLPLALVGAGWPVARRFRETLVRLGLVRPTLVQIGIGLGMGLVLAAFATFVLDPGIASLWRMLGWPTTDLQAFERLMNNFKSPLGAVFIGVTAGVSEELLYRGLLQPRIGLVAANLIFTATHAFQYGFDGLLSVFIIGLVLGIVRSRTNTTTSALVHGTYDFVLVLASALAGS